MSRFLLQSKIAIALLGLAMFLNGSQAGEIQSTLARGDRLEPFQVRDCTGPASGKILCYYCRYGLRPVAAVFVREWTDEIADLIVQIDRQAVIHRDRRLSTFVITIEADTQDVEQRLKTLAATRGITRTPLTIYRDSSRKLALTLGVSRGTKAAVITWRHGEVQSVHGFDQSCLTTAERDRVIADVQALTQ